MTRDELSQLSKEALIDLIIMQAEQIAVLQATLTQFEADFEALKLKVEKGRNPLTNSSNYSQPSSRDQKRNLPSDRFKRKHGPPVGYPKHERKFVTDPDHITDLKAETCMSCHANLHSTEGALHEVKQITELPVAKAEVIEVRQYAVTCPQCGQM
jgi:hypothetical protein